MKRNNNKDKTQSALLLEGDSYKEDAGSSDRGVHERYAVERLLNFGWGLTEGSVEGLGVRRKKECRCHT